MSHEAQTDLRIRRTHKFLQEAMIELITEKGFEAITVGDTPEEFCRHVVTLHTDSEAWTKLSERGLAFTASRHSFANARRVLAQLLSTINAPAKEVIDTAN